MDLGQESYSTGWGGNSIWVHASTGAPSLRAGCQVTVQTKSRAAVSKVESLDGRRRRISIVRPSAETFTQSSDGRGEPVRPSGSGTNGAFTGLGRSSKQEPSEL